MGNTSVKGVKQNGNTRKIQQVLEENEITRTTVLNSNLLNKMLFDLQYTTAGPKILDKKHASLFLTQLFEELGIPIPKEQFSTILGNCMTEQDQFSFDLFRELVNEYLPDDRLTESLLIKIEDLEPLEPPTEKQEQLAEFLRSKDITEKTVITLDLVEEVMEKFTEPGEHTWSRSLTEELLYTFLQETYSPQSKEDISVAIEGNTVTISELCFLIRTLHPYFLSLEILLSTNRPKVRFGTIDRRCKCSILMAVCDSVICCSASGSVWSFHAHSRTPPTQLSNLRDIVSICCSRNFLFFLDINGTVWETPYDFKPGAAIKSNVPARPIEELPVIECFSSGTNHTVCVDCDGNAWMRGSIKSVQPEDSHIFKKIVQEGIELVLFVYCGPAFTFFLCDHGALFCVGLNSNWESYVPPVRTYQYNQKQTSKFDHVAERYTKIVDKSNIVSIACGFTHILFLLDDGAVLTCGRGNSGQLGAGADFQTLVKPSRIDVSDIQSIYASQDQSFCIDSQNRLWAFGGNSVGELGLGDTFFRWAPVLVPNFVARNGMSYTSDFQNLHHRFAIIADDCGDLWFFGQNSAPKKLPDDFSGICGYRQTFSKSARK